MTLKSSLHAFIALATVASLATACQEDESEQLARSNKAISFNIVKSWEQDVTRSASLWTPNKAEYMGCDTLVSDDKQDTLYLERTISDLADETAAAWTRANVSTKENLNAFKVSCVKRNAEKGDSYYFQNLEVSKQASGNFSNTEKPYYWLETGKETYDFYAYAPTTFTGVTNPATAGAPTFAYDATTANCDLTVAKQTEPDNFKESVPLTFDHLLSGIRFKVDDDCADIEITKIEIKGLYLKGNYNSSTEKWEWSSLTTVDDASLKREFTPTPFDTFENKEIDKTDGTEASFFVVPQTIPDGAKLYVTYTKDGDTEPTTASASINGKLEQGKLTTFTLKVEEDADVKFTVVQEGLHLKITFTKGEEKATSLTPSITFAGDTEDLISEQSFYGTGTTPSSNQLAGAGTEYYYDGSFFMSKAIEIYNKRYKELHPDDDSGDYSKYCWDSKKSIAENKAVKTQTYVFSLSDGTNMYSKKVKFHFDYFEYTTNNTAVSASYLYDASSGSGNFTMYDVTNKKWRNSTSGGGMYSDEIISTGQTMTADDNYSSSRTIRVFINNADGVQEIGTTGISTSAVKNNLITLCDNTPLLKSKSGKVTFSDSSKLTSVGAGLMNKQDNLTDLSYCFYNCQALTSLDLSSFDTSNVKTMRLMFYNCNKLTTLDVSNFDTSSVTNMSSMFSGCSGLTDLDVSNFDTSSVTIMSSMFANCSKLTTLDLSNFDTSSVTTMEGMFANCSQLTTLDVSNFNTSSVTTMSQMFSYCWALTTLNLSNFDTSSVTTMSQMFFQCYALTSLNVSSFDTSSVTTMQNMFNLCKTLTSLDVSSFDTSNVTDMGNMFKQCEALESLDLSNFNTSNVKSISNMFSYCYALESLNLKKFSKDKVKTYTNTFSSIGTKSKLGKVTITTNADFKKWMNDNKSSNGLSKAGTINWVIQ